MRYNGLNMLLLLLLLLSFIMYAIINRPISIIIVDDDIVDADADADDDVVIMSSIHHRNIAHIVFLIAMKYINMIMQWKSKEKTDVDHFTSIDSIAIDAQWHECTIRADGKQNLDNR